jgi:hypothetical protein
VVLTVPRRFEIAPVQAMWPCASSQADFQGFWRLCLCAGRTHLVYLQPNSCCTCVVTNCFTVQPHALTSVENASLRRQILHSSGLSAPAVVSVLWRVLTAVLNDNWGQLWVLTDSCGKEQ